MKEIFFLLEELLRLVFHQNADSSVKDFRLGVKSGPREGQRPRFGKKRCSSPKLLSFGTAFPQVTELSLKEMFIPFSSSPAHLYLFGRVFDC